MMLEFKQPALQPRLEQSVEDKQELKEGKLIWRKIKEGDLDDFIELEKEIWIYKKEEQKQAEDAEEIELEKQKTITEPFGEKHFRSWLTTHPEGFLGTFRIVHEGDRLREKIVAYAYAQICYFEPPTEEERRQRLSPLVQLGIPNWSTVTDNGFSKHNPEENCLYVVSIVAHPQVAGEGWNLVKRMRQLAIEKEKPYLAGVVRIPGFQRWFLDKYKDHQKIGDIKASVNGTYLRHKLEKFNIDLYQEFNEYAQLVTDGKVKDPVMSVFYRQTQRAERRREFTKGELFFECIVPDYFSDRVSFDAAALFCWKNPVYEKGVSTKI